jgi:uncharacterized membrane protein YidH (DUF202 family)
VRSTPDTVFDVGAQLERTSLAWVRTALAFTAVGALIGRFANSTAAPALANAIGALVVATGVTAGASAVRSYNRRHAGLHRGRPVASPAPLLCVALALTLASIATLGIAIT